MSEDADEQQIGGVGGGGLVRMQFSVDERTNSIIAAGTRQDLAVVEAILLRLDEGDVGDRVNTVYRLNNASAQGVSETLNAWLQTQRQAEADAEVALSPFEQIEREVVIVPEIATNSLVVSATPRYYEQIKKIIADLDERPPMVMIQVLIAEVRLNDTDEFGVELGLQDSLLFDRSLLSDVQTITTTTTTQSPGGQTVTTEQQNVINANGQPGFNFNSTSAAGQQSAARRRCRTAANVATQGLSNFAMGRSNGDLGFGGFIFSASSNGVNVLLRALQEKRRLEVLSRPQIMAMDGQTGYILVGQRVPTITGVSLTTFGQTNDILYQQVGIIMQVRPRISPDGLVVMQLTTEKSEVGPEAEGIPISVSAGGQVVRAPRINATTAVTTVSALSGQTVVLSGLLTNRREDVHRRVPLLADIPLIGDLFRYDRVSGQRTELLIVLTPQIVRNKLESDVIKQVESSRMSYIMSDVINLAGDLGPAQPLRPMERRRDGSGLPDLCAGRRRSGDSGRGRAVANSAFRSAARATIVRRSDARTGDGPIAETDNYEVTRSDGQACDMTQNRNITTRNLIRCGIAVDTAAAVPGRRAGKSPTCGAWTSRRGATAMMNRKCRSGCSAAGPTRCCINQANRRNGVSVGD